MRDRFTSWMWTSTDGDLQAGQALDLVGDLGANGGATSARLSP